MKKYILPIVCMAAAAVSCQKEISIVSNENRDIVKIVNVEPGEWQEMRTAYQEGTGITLTGTETMSVFYSKYDPALDDQCESQIQSAISATPAGSGRYTFSHGAIQGAETYNYFFFMPHKSSTQRGGSNPQVPLLRIYPIQQPAATSFDPARDILVGRPVFNSELSSELTVSEFKRLGAPLALTVNDSDNLLAGEPVNMVTLNFVDYANPVAGLFTVHASRECSEVELTNVDNTAANALTAMYPAGLSKKDGAYKVWYVALPASFPASQEVELTLMTPTKTLTFQSTLEAGASLVAGKLNSLGFTLSAAKKVGDTAESFVQDFTSSTKNTLPTSLTTTAGDSRIWGFSKCDYKTSEADGHSYLRISGTDAVITLPSFNDKYISSLKLYACENTYQSGSIKVKMELQDNGETIMTKYFGIFEADLRTKGYLEFTGIPEPTGALSVKITYSDGANHQALIAAISGTLAEKSGSGPDPVEIDYYAKYNNGETIMVGDLAVNKTTYGDALLVAPADLKFTNLSGGVVFIDDKNGTEVNIENVKSGTKGISGSKNLVVIGRYANIGKQTTIVPVEMRLGKNAAFFNVKFRGNQYAQYWFAQNSSSTAAVELRLVDCFIDNSAGKDDKGYNGIVNLGNTAKSGGCFSKVLIDNCVVKVNSTEGKISSLFYIGSAVAFSGAQSYEVNNSVIYAATLSQHITFYLTTSSKFDNSGISINLSNNTYYNLRSDNGVMLVANNPASARVSKNVGYLDYVSYTGGKPYSSKVWNLLSESTHDGFEMSDNRFYRENNPGNGVWTMTHPDSKQNPVLTGNSTIDGNPFTKVDLDNGYLPLDASLAGYGANYDTKGYIVK